MEQVGSTPKESVYLDFFLAQGFHDLWVTWNVGVAGVEGAHLLVVVQAQASAWSRILEISRVIGFLENVQGEPEAPEYHIQQDEVG